MENNVYVQKLDENAKLPKLSHEDDAGYDITVIDNGTITVEKINSEILTTVMANNTKSCWRVKYIEYKTGLAIAPPSGYHLEFVARSSVSKYDLILANCLAIGDAGYRNEYRLRFRILPLDIKILVANTEEEAIEEAKKYIKLNDVKVFIAGDRAAQMLIRKTEHMPLVEIDNLSETERGMGGFGSTGR
jgi:dUTP pyrophosphatase